MGKTVRVAAIALAGLLVTTRASADAEGDAQRLFEDAKVLVRAGNYPAACPKLEESQRLDPALGTEFNLADCYEHVARKAAAWSLFTEVERSARAAGKSEREKSAHARAAALEPAIGRLTISAAAPSESLQIARDGQRLPREAWGHAVAVEPGEYAVTATEAGKISFEQRIHVAGGASVTVAIPVLDLTPVASVVPLRETAAPTPTAREQQSGLSGQRRLAILAGGLGVAGLGVGSVFGLISTSDHHAATNLCANPNPCGSAEGARDWTSATRAGTVSTVSFIAGGAALATGIVLWLLASPSADRKNARVHTAPIFSADVAGISGRW